MSFLDKFVTTLIKALALVIGHSSSSSSHDHQNHTHTHDPLSSSDKYSCKFCSEKGHYVIDCPTCKHYINEGKIKGIATIKLFFHLAHIFLVQLKEKIFVIALMNITVAIQAKLQQTRSLVTRILLDR